MSFYRAVGKRLFDLALAIPALIVAGPLLALVASLVRARLGSPVLFRQQRPGLHGRPFAILKFRTMTNERDADGRLLPDAHRMTPLGRLLRRTSLDEIPALINVIRGEMSLVGPRPLLMEYLGRYTPQQARRHEAVPGITGWAQIHGRNDVLFSERLKLDVWYVEHLSLSLDLRILCETLLKVVRASGVRLDQTLQEVDDIGLHPETRQDVLASPLSAAGATWTERKGVTSAR